MKKRVFGRQLKRDTNERKALFKGLASSLILHERIETTEEKAKAVKGYIEKLVTKAKKNDAFQAERLLQAHLSTDAVKKLLTDVAPRFTARPGGYTRIIKIGQRFSDNASMVLLEWVEKPVAPAMKEKKRGKKETTLAAETTVSKETPKTREKSATKAKTKSSSKKTVKEKEETK